MKSRRFSERKIPLLLDLFQSIDRKSDQNVYRLTSRAILVKMGGGDGEASNNQGLPLS